MDRIQTRKDALLNQECYGTFSGGVCQANGYDGNGNLVQFTDRRGKVAKFSYDGLNRMTFAGTAGRQEQRMKARSITPLRCRESA